MDKVSRKSVPAAVRFEKKVVFALALAVAMGMSARLASAQQSRMAEDVYKDIEVLRGMPADQLNATMQLFEAGLGVGCDYCHADDRAEDTERKDVARKMVEMVHAINRDTFGGDREVSCFTCHRGNVNPPANAGLADADYRGWEPDRPNGSPNPPPVPGPPPAQILDKWISAIGGMDAINKITSRVVRGTVTDSEGNSFHGEIVTKGDRALFMNINENVTFGRTGNTGWFRAANGNVRDIRNYEYNFTRFEDLLYLAKNVKSFTQLTSRQDEIRGGVAVYQVRGVAPGNVPVRMWFSRETGNLLRTVWFTETPVGQNVSRVDWFDFDEVGDTIFPLRWVVRTPLSFERVRVESVQHNVDIDDARFNRPPPRQR